LGVKYALGCGFIYFVLVPPLVGAIENDDDGAVYVIFAFALSVFFVFLVFL
jgi:hypothetical protein